MTIKNKLEEFEEQLNNDCELPFLQNLFNEIFEKELKGNIIEETDRLIIELIDRLFELDEDKNDSLSDHGERWRYGKIRDRLKKGLKEK